MNRLTDEQLAALQALLLEHERAEDRLAASGSDCDLLKALNARDAFEQACGKHGEALIAEVQALRAERERLRAALQQIATGKIAGEPNNHRDTLAIVREIAVATLKDGK